VAHGETFAAPEIVRRLPEEVFLDATRQEEIKDAVPDHDADHQPEADEPPPHVE
jgi:hypothetical protein